MSLQWKKAMGKLESQVDKEPGGAAVKHHPRISKWSQAGWEEPWSQRYMWSRVSIKMLHIESTVLCFFTSRGLLLPVLGKS